MLCFVDQSVTEASITLPGDAQSVYQDDVHRSLSVRITVTVILHAYSILLEVLILFITESSLWWICSVKLSSHITMKPVL